LQEVATAWLITPIAWKSDRRPFVTMGDETLAIGGLRTNCSQRALMSPDRPLMEELFRDELLPTASPQHVVSGCAERHLFGFRIQTNSHLI
jgi:hypothetical protein